MAHSHCSATAAASIAIAGKSSRACDGCGVQRAQWYCAADEAYLCDRCDTGVHSANSVAWRHERVRLAPNGAPLKMPKRSSSAASSHHLSKPYKNKGRLRSSTTDHRAPSSKKVCKSSSRASREVHEQKVKVEFVDPCEISCDEVVDNYDDDGGGEAPHEVPAFITVIQDSHETSSQISLQQGYNVTGSRFLHEVVGHSASDSDSSFLSGFFKGKAALAQGGGNLRQQSWDLENCIPPTPSPFARFFASSRVKTEEEEDVTKQTLQGPAEKLKKKAKEILKCSLEGLSEEDLRHVPSLRLDYEEVLNAWSDRGALWTDDDNLSGSQTVPGGEDSFNSDDASLSNEGREARVLRYKEKRRTRLFSKKIRYEVRKLNAERRPRMKGRFVKRIQLLSR
ncbi:unnamed protein product [Sphagnum jensenii]|uniref:Uncharacterized protein n=1 Tax=Sphagnum jensenii TaxID=128206 RepID=A0ABP0X793_9BRYO